MLSSNQPRCSRTLLGTFRQTPACVKSALAEVVAAPVLWQPLEAIEAMHDAPADPSGDETNGAADEHPEFEIVAIDLHRTDGELQDFGWRFEADRVRYCAVDVVDRACNARSERSRIGWMRPTSLT